jgi:hypothetical protein
MKPRTQASGRAALEVRIQRLTGEIERLLPEVKEAVGSGGEPGFPLAPAAQALERAARAIRVLVERTKAKDPDAAIRAQMLGGMSPLLSLFGSRVVLANIGATIAAEPAKTASAGAQALALLLEEPQRTFEAAEVAARLGCSLPIARTTLNRLVKSGHAARPAAGRFCAKPGKR